MTFVQAIVALVAAQRLAELVYARRNAKRLIAAGGVEVGAGHYPVLVLVQAGWLAALGFLVPGAAPVRWPWLAVFALLQVGRLWVQWSLGRFWTTRIVTLPGAPLVTRGPYRFCRHPNYVVVVGEIAALPLAFDAWFIALAFSLLNGTALAWRIRVENAALAGRARGAGPDRRL